MVKGRHVIQGIGIASHTYIRSTAAYSLTIKESPALSLDKSSFNFES